MKILLISVLLFLTGIVGCSSKSKKAQSPAVQTPATSSVKTETTPQPMTTKAEEPKTQMNSDKSLKSLICTRDSETRNLTIENAAPKGCKLLYSNFHPTNPVAWSSWGHEHCESVMERIKGKLEDANYKCQ